MDEELEFEDDLRTLLDQWDGLDIYTTKMRAMLEDVGAVETAKHYVRKTTGGFGEAYEKLSPRQTLEGLRQVSAPLRRRGCAGEAGQAGSPERVVAAIEAGRTNLTLGRLAALADPLGSGLEVRFPAMTLRPAAG